MSHPLQTVYHETEEKMKRTTANTQRELQEIRGGRASPSLVEHITVDYYGAATPIRQVAAITAPEPRMLLVQPWDPALATAIEKAILKASLGITPQVDGKVVRLPIPSLTGERRTELTKLIHHMAEEGRVSVRNARRDAIESIRKLKGQNLLTEDDVKESQDHVQKLTDRYIGDLNTLAELKEKELQSG